MPTFTNTFGGTSIYPANVSYRAVSLTANVTLAWPTELATDTNVVAAIMDVTPSAANLVINMPPANEVSVGECPLFFNAGSDTFYVADNNSNTITSVAPGLAYQVYLTDNTTVNGTWRSTQFGAGTSSATAGSLVGLGIKAINSTLNQKLNVVSLLTTYTLGTSDRASAFVWGAGAGTVNLSSAITLGNDWFCEFRNSGTGAVNLSTSIGGQTVNGGATLIFNPGDSATIICDGTNFFTIGFGQSAAFSFDYVSIDLTAQSTPYTLSGANLNRIAYSFGGTIGSNFQIIVPNTVQQYWVTNSTTVGSSAYTIEIKTASGTGVTLSRNSSGIFYCNGTNMVDADSSTVSLPIQVNQGGTGATTASGARTNLGATSVGNAVFTASSQATGRAALGAAASGANSDVTSLTGLTTPLSAAQGGTGQPYYEPVNNGAVYGYTCSNNISNPTTRLNISIGNCRDSTNTRGINLATPLVKILTSTWAAGTNQGGKDSGVAVAAGQTWHVHAILNPTTMAVDILFSQSATAPTLPTGYTYFRRVMSIITEAASSSIRQFLQTGDTVQLITRGTEWSATSNGVSTGTLRTVGVPTGLKCLTNFYYQSQNSGAGTAPQPTFSGIYDPDVGVPTYGSSTQWAQIRVNYDAGTNDRYQTRIIQMYTNTSAQVYTASNDAYDLIAGGVLSWVDPRNQYY